MGWRTTCKSDILPGIMREREVEVRFGSVIKVKDNAYGTGRARGIAYRATTESFSSAEILSDNPKKLAPSGGMQIDMLDDVLEEPAWSANDVWEATKWRFYDRGEYILTEEEEQKSIEQLRELANKEPVLIRRS